MTHFLCTRVRRGYLPCATQCADCRAEEDATTPGPLQPAAVMVCFDCGRSRRPGSEFCQCGSNTFVEARPLSLKLPVAETTEHTPQAVIRGCEATELPGTERTWSEWDAETITMELMTNL